MKIGKLYDEVLGEEYPSSWNIEEFANLKSFNQRKNYCEQNLRRISSGSGRIVYQVDNEKVLKLAKNKKGVAQNEVEIQYGNERYFSSIIGQTYNSDDNALWVEMELAKRVSPKQFKNIVGVDIDTFGGYIRNQVAVNRGRPSYFRIDPDIKEQLDNNEIANDTIDFVMNTDSEAGDIGRLSTWGLVHREGSDSLVIIDYGLTQGVYTTYYR
jgi:hypothetical protein